MRRTRDSDYRAATAGRRVSFDRNDRDNLPDPGVGRDRHPRHIGTRGPLGARVDEYFVAHGSRADGLGRRGQRDLREGDTSEQGKQSPEAEDGAHTQDGGGIRRY